ncbi:WD40/YVTN/BNR-like repeat-containing protein [Pseudomonas koreensis]|uniref:YCF48-related protein n=1 Tax=Pseudomonas koreensis TaxID=198620 RepID=A0A9X3BDP7_9PSED|nr:YCF48-related protein [Pseudomonas koreensis]MCU7250895.1 YCF48-related protein [Pseudomonas koreensis]
MSFRFFRRCWKVAVIACVCLFLAVPGAYAETGSLDLLERAAPDNPQASRGVLMDVTRINKMLVAVGERGLVLQSADNGFTWHQSRVPVSVALTGVRFVDERQGWAIGHSGVVLHTADAGVTWQKQLDGRVVAQLEVAAAERDQDPGRQRTAKRLLAEGADKPWLDLLFVDSQRGWLIGAYGLFMRTRDGGATWSSAMGDIDNPTGLHLYAIRVIGERMVIAGEQGALFVSGDGGEHFKRIESPYEGSFFGLASDRAGDLVVYGLRGNAWRLGAGEENWQAIDMGNDVTLTADARTNNGDLLLADEAGRISYSRDDGRSFQPLTEAAKGYVSGLTQAADGALVVVGARGVQRIESEEVQP